MKFKTFTWPHNPSTYHVTFQRLVAVNKVPFGKYMLQDLGVTRRIMEGEGVFTGPEAYQNFAKLAALFYEGTPGALVHPIWSATSARLVKLELEEAPRADYVKYSFTFWEDYSGYSSQSNGTVTKAAASTSSSASASSKRYYTVVKGDTLWAIARKYSTTVAAISALNPSLKNPNLIQVGQVLRIA
jgi:prophage DNA circulation protein